MGGFGVKVQHFPLTLLVVLTTLTLPCERDWANFGGFGGLGARGFKKLQFLPQKARPCVNPRRLSHFASKSVEGCDLQVG